MDRNGLNLHVALQRAMISAHNTGENTEAQRAGYPLGHQRACRTDGAET